MAERHTDRDFAGDLADLSDRVLLMGARVEKATELALEAIQTRSSESARQIIAEDEQVDRLEIEVEQLCLKILALRHPVASDLRFVTAALRLVTDLGRIGNLCVNIAGVVLEMRSEPRQELPPAIQSMGDAVRGMLRDALDAFVDRDAAKAGQIGARDRRVDASYAALLSEVFEQVSTDRDRKVGAARLQALGKYLERIGDHATNVADMVIFMVEGRRDRHR